MILGIRVLITIAKENGIRPQVLSAQNTGKGIASFMFTVDGAKIEFIPDTTVIIFLGQ